MHSRPHLVTPLPGIDHGYAGGRKGNRVARRHDEAARRRDRGNLAVCY
jgi:hypothetical protein